jgi:hypothetical protein
MATNDFKRYTYNDVTTAAAVVYTVGATKTAVIIGGVLSNTTAGTVKVEVTATTPVASPGTDIVINLTGENTVIPAASALSFVDGKIVLQTGDIIKVTSDTATSVDVHLSVMEITP